MAPNIIWRQLIEGDIETLPKLIARQAIERPELAASNSSRLSGFFFELGVLNWREGKDPRPQFIAAGEWYDKAWGLASDRDKIGIAYSMGPIETAQYLVGRPARLAFVWPEHAESEYVPFKYEIAFRLHDRVVPPELQAFNDGEARRTNYVICRSFVTYRKLLDYKGNGSGLNALIAEAEQNWLDRKKDRRLRDSHFILGGKSDNDIVVDFELGAILKKLNWQGESIHKWQWG